MAASHILTGGYGNGSLVGSPSLVLSLGYGSGSSVVTYFAGCGPRSVTNIGPRGVLGVGILSVTNIGPRSVECCDDC